MTATIIGVSVLGLALPETGRMMATIIGVSGLDSRYRKQDV